MLEINKMIPKKLYKEIQKHICRNVGTVEFGFTSANFFNNQSESGILIQIPSGEHLFRLERDEKMHLHFYHSSPGTGTRVATLDLKIIPPSPDIHLAFSWSPTEINLHLASKNTGTPLFSAKGVQSTKEFRVGKDGNVYQIGDDSVETMGVSMYIGGKPIVQSTAINAWKETKNAVDILSTGKSNIGFTHECVVTNLTLAILVTGFEAYTKKRFLEIEKEGYSPDQDLLDESFFTNKEIEAGVPHLLRSNAEEERKTYLEIIVESNRINFQNYDKCKYAYNRAYQIKFGDIELLPNTLANIKKYIKYRHRIIHVSALIGMLNQPDVPPEEPVFSKKDLAEKAIKDFDLFINKLHERTLTIKK